MKRVGVSFGAGVLFSVGLVVSGMTKPSKVVGFLDVSGDWDPSLAFVMIGAIAVNSLLVRWATGRKQPILGGKFRLPENSRIDARLIVGSSLFGIGWGLGGFCPGPAFVASATAAPGTLLFVAAMLAGMGVHRVVHEGGDDSEASSEAEFAGD